MEPTWQIIDTHKGDTFFDLLDNKYKINSGICIMCKDDGEVVISCGVDDGNMCLVLTKKTALAVKKFLEINL